jgi:hypothetical protein
MMSDYSGHDRPFPAWFPYAVSGAILTTTIIFTFNVIL